MPPGWFPRSDVTSYATPSRIIHASPGVQCRETSSAVTSGRFSLTERRASSTAAPSESSHPVADQMPHTHAIAARPAAEVATGREWRDSVETSRPALWRALLKTGADTGRMREARLSTLAVRQSAPGRISNTRLLQTQRGMGKSGYASSKEARLQKIRSGDIIVGGLDAEGEDSRWNLPCVARRRSPSKMPSELQKAVPAWCQRDPGVPSCQRLL